MPKSSLWLARHIQSVRYQVGVVIIIDRPANNLSTEGIKNGAAIKFALSDGIFSNVGD